MKSNTFLSCLITFSLLFSSFRAYQPPCQLVYQPDSVPCGVRGTIEKAPLVNNIAVADSLARCRDLCFRRGPRAGNPNGGFCRALRFNEERKTCALLYDITTKDITRNDSSSDIFYSKSCFDCPPLLCPIPPNPHLNLIDNGGFEDSDTLTGPWAQGHGDGYAYHHGLKPSHPGINSSNAIRCRDGRTFEQFHQFCPGQTHRLQVDIFNVVKKRKDSPGIQSGAPGGQIDMRPAGPTGKKPRKFVAFYTPELEAGSTGFFADTLFSSDVRIDVDNFVLRPVDMSRNRFIGDNKVINPGFETGQVKPWKISSTPHANYSVVSPGLQGSKYAVKFTRTKKYASVRLTPKIEPPGFQIGKLYRVDLKLKPPSGMSVDFAGRDMFFITGLSNYAQYFYAEEGMFPLNLTFGISGVSVVTLDYVSIRQIEE